MIDDIIKLLKAFLEILKDYGKVTALAVLAAGLFLAGLFLMTKSKPMLLASILMALGLALGLTLALVVWFKRPSRAPLRINTSVLKGANPFQPDEGPLFLKLDREAEIKRLTSLILGDQVTVIILSGPAAVGKTSLVNAGLREALKGKREFTYLPAPQTFEPLFTTDATRRVVVIDRTETMAPEVREALVNLLKQAIAQTDPLNIYILVIDAEESEEFWREQDFGPDAAHRLIWEGLGRFSIQKAKFVAATLKQEALIAAPKEKVEGMVHGLSFDEHLGLEQRISPLSLSVAMEALAERAALHEGSEGPSGIELMAEFLIETVTQRTRQDWRDSLLPIIKLAADVQEFDLHALTGQDDSEYKKKMAFLLRILSSQDVRVIRQVWGSPDRFRILEEWLPVLRSLDERAEQEPEEGEVTNRVRIKYVAWRERHKLDKERVWWKVFREGAFLLTRKEIREIDNLRPQRVLDDRRFLYFIDRSRNYRAIWTLAALGLFGILVSTAYGFIQRHKQLEELTLLKGFGIPADIGRYAQDVSTLKVGCGVGNLRWVPAKVAVLSANCERINNLEGIPAGVTHLNLSLTSIQSIQGVPEGVEDLDISLTRIRTLPQFALPKLKSLNVGRIPIKNLRHIPRSITDLTMGNVEVRSLNGLPELRSLTLSGSEIDSLKALPTSLRILKIQKSVRRIDYLPPALESLETDALPVDGAYPASLRKLTVLEKHLAKVPEQIVELELIQSSFEGELPVGLKIFRISGSKMAVALNRLPAGLITLSMPWRDGLRFSDLPESLEVLEIDFPERDVSFDGLRPRVKTLSLTGGDLNSLRRIPRSVERFTCRYCALLEAKEIPVQLKALDLSGCEDLASIGSLPLDVEELNVHDTALSSLGALPPKLKKLDISDTHVSVLPELSEGLVELIVTNGQLESLEGLPSSVRVLSILAPRSNPLAP